MLLRLLKVDQLESGGCGLGGGAHLSSWAAGHVVGMAGNCRAGFACRARQVVMKVYGVVATRPQG